MAWKNWSDWYDLRQCQPRTSTCLVVTWGYTNLIPGLYRSQYQVYICHIPAKNQPCPDSNIRIRLVASVFKRSDTTSSWYVWKLIPTQHWYKPCKWVCSFLLETGNGMAEATRAWEAAVWVDDRWLSCNRKHSEWVQQPSSYSWRKEHSPQVHNFSI